MPTPSRTHLRAWRRSVVLVGAVKRTIGQVVKPITQFTRPGESLRWLVSVDPADHDRLALGDVRRDVDRVGRKPGQLGEAFIGGLLKPGERMRRPGLREAGR